MNGVVTSDTEQGLLNIKSINFDKILYVDCYYNKISLPGLKITFSVNESQKRLLLCLLSNIHGKQEIIQIIWNDSHLRVRDNNYHQLVFQMRALLQRNGLPADLIITVPHYGLKLNAPLLKELTDCRAPNANIVPKRMDVRGIKITPLNEVDDEVESENAASDKTSLRKSRMKKVLTCLSFLTKILQKK